MGRHSKPEDDGKNEKKLSDAMKKATKKVEPKKGLKDIIDRTDRKDKNN